MSAVNKASLNAACVACLDMCWEGFAGVKVVSLPGDVAYARNHGVFLTDQQVRGIL